MPWPMLASGLSTIRPFPLSQLFARLQHVFAQPPSWSPRARLYAAVGVVAVVVQIAGYLVLSAQRQIPLGRDAWSYIAAARAIAAGESPYTSDLAAFLPDAPEDPPPYLYPPLLAFLLIPVADRPLSDALALWFVIVGLGHLLLVLALRPLAGWRTALLAVLAWFPTWQGAYYGQVNAWVAVSLALAVIGIRQGRTGRSALWLACGALLKITPAVALVMLALHRPRRALAVGAAAVLLALVATLPLVPPRLWLAGGAAALTTPRANPWHTSWGAALGQLPGALGAAAPLLVAAGAVLLTVWRGRRLPLPLALAAATLVPLLVARTVWPHHALTALPALALLWTWSTRGRWLALVTWAGVGLIGDVLMPLLLTACWAACLWPSLLADAPAAQHDGAHREEA